MTYPKRLLALLLLSALPACAPYTLTRSAAGWSADGAIYSLAPAGGGDVMPPGWTLENYERAGDHFNKRYDLHARDFMMRRGDDDGVLAVKTQELLEEERPKKLDVLAERWLGRVVTDPPQYVYDIAPFDDVVPPLKTTSTIQYGLHTATAETRRGRDCDIARREAFTVANGEAIELEVNLVPRGAPGPDRRLYLALLRPSSGDRLVVLAYANSPAMFANGLSDAAGLAHRIRFIAGSASR